ncbi:hypothetical protein N0V83_005261 [Neocucurbitaria cava]|uniref:N-alpha-acetyltransferase 40 n=1 Tax=Neocucurbitaria cava TaxID=798079 RepID=A0A9W9CN05_9PLEO|nr:hypothetical protein N0V83_005261 [Neocucurbitaria cava]
MPRTRYQQEIVTWKQQFKKEFNRNPTYIPSIPDPRQITEEPTHTYLDADDMPHIVDPRAREIQKLFEEDITGLRAYEAPQLVCPLKFDFVRSGHDLKIKELSACLSLVESTSGRDYRASRIGWDPNNKKAEMLDKNMIYLLIRQGDVGGPVEQVPEDDLQEGDVDMDLPPAQQGDDDGLVEQAPQNELQAGEAHMNSSPSQQLNALEQLIQGYASDGDAEDTANAESTLKPDSPPSSPVPFIGPQPPTLVEWPDPGNNGRMFGFVSFMFTYDDPPHDDREVVYLYEIHLHHQLRGRGLGSNLIKFVERAAAHCGISKVMLTVFVANATAMALYEKLGYTKDECSPEGRVTRKKTFPPEYLILSKTIPCIST